MADGPCAYEKWIRERFSENLRPSACRHHRSFLCIAARRLAMAWSFSTSFPKPLELLGGLLSGKILRAACLVKRTTSITGALRATFTAAGAAPTLAELQISRVVVSIAGSSGQFRGRATLGILFPGRLGSGGLMRLGRVRERIYAFKSVER